MKQVNIDFTKYDITEFKNLFLTSGTPTLSKGSAYGGIKVVPPAIGDYLAVLDLPLSTRNKNQMYMEKVALVCGTKNYFFMGFVWPGYGGLQGIGVGLADDGPGTDYIGDGDLQINAQNHTMGPNNVASYTSGSSIYLELSMRLRRR